MKGESPNPGGREKAEYSITALIDEAMTKEDWIFVIALLVKKARSGNFKAIEMLMDRRFGKAVQMNEHAGKDGQPLRIEVVYVDDSIR